ncbi:MAG: anti-sigma factor [Actinomycetota bacterium]|nr:anti-sigma factor [Actinomycetota bacterium]
MNDDAMRENQFAEEIAGDPAEGRVLELAEVYALDAVSDEERANIEEYISAAPEPVRRGFGERVCQARETLTATFAADQAQPPADLLGQILAQLPGRAQGRLQHKSREHNARRRDLSTGRRWLVGMAAGALIAIGGVAVGSSIIRTQDPVQQILNAADVQTRILPIPGGGTATLAISRARDAAVVTMESVPAPPPGKVYQMWLVPKNGTAPVSQGIMDAQALTRSAAIRGVDTALLFAITVEPAGGSTAPTLPTVASLPLTS